MLLLSEFQERGYTRCSVAVPSPVSEWRDWVHPDDDDEEYEVSTRYAPQMNVECIQEIAEADDL